MLANQVGEIDDAVWLGRGHRGHDLVEVRDIAAHRGDLPAEIGERVRAGMRVHAGHDRPPRHKQAHKSVADKTGAPDHEGSQMTPSTVGGSLRMSLALLGVGAQREHVRHIVGVLSIDPLAQSDIEHQIRTPDSTPPHLQEHRWRRASA